MKTLGIQNEELCNFVLDLNLEVGAAFQYVFNMGIIFMNLMKKVIHCNPHGPNNLYRT
jgi:hypothetical protein